MNPTLEAVAFLPAAVQWTLRNMGFEIRVMDVGDVCSDLSTRRSHSGFEGYQTALGGYQQWLAGSCRWVEGTRRLLGAQRSVSRVVSKGNTGGRKRG